MINDINTIIEKLPEDITAYSQQCAPGVYVLVKSNDMSLPERGRLVRQIETFLLEIGYLNEISR